LTKSQQFEKTKLGVGLLSEPAPGIGDLGSRLGRQDAGGAKFKKKINFHK